jgi:hypothetical protein
MASMTEPDVALTDYALAVECGLFAYLLLRSGHPRQSLCHAFTLFFGALCLSSLAGGTVHGFFLDEASWGYRLLWPATLLGIGLTAFAAWWAGAEIIFQRKTAALVRNMAAVLLGVYGIIVLGVSQTFLVPIAHYLPPALFLLISYMTMYRQTKAPPLFIGILGLGLTFVAAGVQQAKVAVHPIYFNHNAFYHVIQAAALFMIFWSARWLVRKESP